MEHKDLLLYAEAATDLIIELVKAGNLDACKFVLEQVKSK